jgi:hypothetical protein
MATESAVIVAKAEAVALAGAMAVAVAAIAGHFGAERAPYYYRD